MRPASSSSPQRIAVPRQVNDCPGGTQAGSGTSSRGVQTRVFASFSVKPTGANAARADAH